jgi:hypothetical protein
MKFIEIERHENGPRVRILRQRVHHGAVGVPLLAFPRTRIIGAVLIAHDAHDLPRWFQPGPQR